jgi:hypothetical protein
MDNLSANTLNHVMGKPSNISRKNGLLLGPALVGSPTGTINLSPLAARGVLGIQHSICLPPY